VGAAQRRCNIGCILLGSALPGPEIGFAGSKNNLRGDQEISWANLGGGVPATGDASKDKAGLHPRSHLRLGLPVNLRFYHCHHYGLADGARARLQGQRRWDHNASFLDRPHDYQPLAKNLEDLVDPDSCPLRKRRPGNGRCSWSGGGFVSGVFTRWSLRL